MVRRLRIIRRSLKTFALATLIVASVVVEPAAAIIQGSGQVVYSEGTVATPRNRELRNQEDTWIPETSLPTSSSSIRHIIVKSSPTRNEMIAGVVNNSGLLTVYLWNGDTWATQWTVTVGLSTTPRFGIAYQAGGFTPGSAIVFYSTNTSGSSQIANRTLIGGSWGPVQSYTTLRTSGVVDSIIVEVDKNSNVMVAWVDVNRDLSANYFLTGSNSRGEPAAALDTNVTVISGSSTVNAPNYDVAFEEVSGRAMVVWGSSAYSGLRTVIRTNGVVGTWQTIQTPSAFQSQGLVLELVSRAGSNDIAYINHSDWRAPGTAANGVEAAVWNGSSWTASGYYTPPAATSGEKDVGVAWLTSGGVTKAVFVYDQASTSGINYFVYDKTSNSFGATQTYSTAPTPPSGKNLIYLKSNPFNTAEATALVTSGANLYAKRVSFNGTTVSWHNTDPGGSVMESNLSTGSTPGWYMNFDYNLFIPTPVLATDIITSAGASVGSPSTTFSSVASGATCQTTTGTLGDASNQLIQVVNTTNNPAWTLTIAPTGGSSANWSSTTESYDFNDPTALGCGDGGDADNLPGQMSMTPLTGSLSTSKPGCTTSNVSKGSAASFSEGVVNSLTLLSGSSSAQIDCIWMFHSIPISQKIPAFTAPGAYSLPMTITSTAS